MALPPRFTGLALAAMTLAGGLISIPAAQAQDMVDFMWGGGEEYGGGRSVVSFSQKYKPGQIIVSFSDRRLYLITKPGQAITYPIAVPKADARWQGVTFVSNKRVNPSWTPTPEMISKNPRLPRWVPGGHPMNPLGIRALYLGSSAYRIHGTDAPWTIGQAASAGCIRMTNKDVLDLYPRIPVGTRVTVTWERFKTGSGRYSSSDYDYSNRSAAAYNSQSSNEEDYSAADVADTPAPTPAPRQAARSNGAAPDGSLSSLFFWDDAPAARKTAAPAAAQKAPVAKAPTRTAAVADEGVDATVEMDEPAVAPTPAKKSASTATPAKKKAESKAPAAPYANVSDPVKTRSPAAADPVSSKTVVAATKAAASSTDTAALQKSTEQSQ